jgi:dTDP-4-dehydrorhamnose reductase
MRIVITGGPEGQILRSLAERGAAAGHDIIPLGRPHLDLIGDEQTIVRAVEQAAPEVMISAAAYTAVDKAESDQDLAFAINASGAGAVARAADRLGVPIIHLSTDYVFDGSKGSPYTEDDVPRPKGVYGASKLAGEQAVLAASPGAVVVRTAWVYSPFDTNFVKTMLRLAADREEVGVVADQRGNPTSALEIAEGILAVAANLVSSQSGELRGVFHMTANGEATWAEFAESIFAASAAAGGPTARVRPIATADYPTPAARPANSCLDSSKLARIHGVRLPDWRCSIDEVVRRLVAEQSLEQGRNR